MANRARGAAVVTDPSPCLACAPGVEQPLDVLAFRTGRRLDGENAGTLTGRGSGRRRHGRHDQRLRGRGRRTLGGEAGERMQDEADRVQLLLEQQLTAVVDGDAVGAVGRERLVEAVDDELHRRVP